MKRYFFILLCLFFILETAFAQYGTVLVGIKQANITPPVGYAHYRGVSSGISDSLYAKAVVFRDGDHTFAFIVCDLLWIERDLSSQVRQLIHQQTGIPYGHILLSATHTHNGPAYHFNIRELNGTNRLADHRDPLIEDKAYEDWLPLQIASAAAIAYEQAEECKLETLNLQVDDLSFNRRFSMLNGTVRMNPGMANPALDRPVGLVDPTFSVMLIRRLSDGQATGCIANFGLHADTFGGDTFGADFPGYLGANLREYFGDDFIAVFATGPCGDINHIDFLGKRPRLKSPQIGKRLSDEILGHLDGFKPEDTRFQTASTQVFAPLQDYTEEALIWASTDPLDSIYPEARFLTYRRSLKTKSLQRLRSTGEAIPPSISGAPWTLPLLVQVFKVSDQTAIVGMPGELFAQFGKMVRDASPFKNTLIVELTHCHIAYVPTVEAFSQGGYEAINSRLAPGGGELLCEAAIELLHEVK